jgi:hypothetical protein
MRSFTKVDLSAARDGLLLAMVTQEATMVEKHKARLVPHLWEAVWFS